MKEIMQYIAIGLSVTGLLSSCATQIIDKETSTTPKNTQVYKQVETKLQQPLNSDSTADLKVLIENHHKDVTMDMVQCIYAEKYLKKQTCTSKKMQNNQAVMVKCVAADDLSYPAPERGSCAKLICIDTDRADCLREGNRAMSITF